MTSKGVFLKQKIFFAFSNPLFYACAIVLNIFCCFQFFFLQNFFAGGGTTDLHYFFNAIPYISIIIIPVLCLNIKKDYESIFPFTRLFIILSDWITVFAQFFAMIIPLLLVPACVNLFGDIDFGQIFSSVFLILLYGGTATATCIFFRYLCQSKTPFFLISAIILGLTNSIHLFSRHIATSSILIPLVKTLSFSWHFDSAAKGILDSRDIVYFISVAILFIFLANYQRAERRRSVVEKLIELATHAERCRSVRSLSEKATLIMYVLIFILLNMNSTRYFFKIDLTKQKKYSISKYSKNLVDTAENLISITYYRSSVLSSFYPQVRDIYDILLEYAASKNVSVMEISPEKQNLSSLLENYGIFPRQIRTAGNNKTEFTNVYSSIVVEYNGNWEIIPFILSGETLEYDLDGRILHLLTQKARYVNIVCANGMSLQKDYSYVVPYLSSQGFICNELKIADFSNDLEKAKNYGDLLFVIGSSKFSEEDCASLESYLQSGKKVLFAVSPYSADIEGSWHISKSENQNLINMLSSYGVDFSGNLILDLSCARITMESSENEGENGIYGGLGGNVYSRQINYFEWISLWPQKNARQGLTLFWPCEMSFPDSSVENDGKQNFKPLLYSSPYSYSLSPDKNSNLSLFETNPFLLEEAGFNPEKKSTEQKAVALEFSGSLNGLYNGGTFDNIKFNIIPEQYFVSSLMLGYIGGNFDDFRNLDFLVNRLLRLNDEENLADLQEKFAGSSKNFLYKTSDEASFISAKKETIACLFIVTPILLCVAGGMMIILRKKFLKVRFM